MKNLLIILLAALVVVAGAFLPQFLLAHSAAPQLDMDYAQVEVSGQGSSDLAWRLREIGEHFYGEGEDQLSPYVSGGLPEEERQSLRSLFFRELFQMSESRVITPELLLELKELEDYDVDTLYIFNNSAMKGFQIAQLRIRGDRREYQVCLDTESGKICRILISGAEPNRAEALRHPDVSSWYDILRNYAAYLGLEQTAIQPASTQESAARDYYDRHTADRFAAYFSGPAEGWLELRVLEDNFRIDLCVYQGGE